MQLSSLQNGQLHFERGAAGCSVTVDKRSHDVVQRACRSSLQRLPIYKTEQRVETTYERWKVVGKQFSTSLIRGLS